MSICRISEHVMQFTTTSAIHISEMDRVSLVFFMPVNQHQRKCALGGQKNSAVLKLFSAFLIIWTVQMFSR